jgi:phosphoribosyl 1,2-cyclic phosphodiesterase
MAIEVISIGSSSSGNSYLIMAGRYTILLDVGLTAKRIVGALDKFNIDPEQVDAVLVTHEHIDHVRSVRAIGRKCCNAMFVASRGTAEHTESFKYIPEERLRMVEAGDTIELRVGHRVDYGGESADSDINYSDHCNNVTIKAFPISHDAAEPLSYTIEYGGEKLAIVTDTGIVTDSIYDAIRDADTLVLESNHDEDLLMFGEYPYSLKMRIKGEYGHLSNRYAGEILAKLLQDRASSGDADKNSLGSLNMPETKQGLRPAFAQANATDINYVSSPLRIMLAHLSFHNNAPFYARTTIEQILKESGFEKGRDYTLTIAAKDEITIFT